MTIFAVQRFLEDHFERRGLADVDQYAIRAANAFDRVGARASAKELVAELARIRTAFFRRNSGLSRKEFESSLAETLRRRFQKKNSNPADLAAFTKRLRSLRRPHISRRRSIGALLNDFKSAVEARGVDAFWESRTNDRLRPKPEKIAQAMLAVSARVLIRDHGLVLREMSSGIGFVDVGISFGGALHLVELKILKGRLAGANQLAMYMRTEGRGSGWLVLVDTRRRKRNAVPAKIGTKYGVITTVLVDVNPGAPHDQ